MSIKRSYISSPALTFAILCIGLGCIVAATLKQNLAIAGLVAALPALLCILILHLRKPERFLFLLFIFNYFFTPLARYSRQDGLSVLSDIIWWRVLLIVIIQTALHYRFPWKRAVNILTIGGAVLAVYCLMEVVNPTASLEAWIYSRGFIYNTFLVSLITVLLATSYKQISRLIFLFSILTLIAILKGLCQKFIGFDAVEYNDGKRHVQDTLAAPDHPLLLHLYRCGELRFQHGIYLRAVRYCRLVLQEVQPESILLFHLRTLIILDVHYRYPRSYRSAPGQSAAFCAYQQEHQADERCRSGRNLHLCFLRIYIRRRKQLHDTAHAHGIPSQ